MTMMMMMKMHPSLLHLHMEADDDSSSGSDSEGEVLPPGQEFVEYMTSLFFASTSSAQHFCMRAGTEEAQPHAFPPGSPTGHFVRHFRSTMPFLRETHRLHTFRSQRTTGTMEVALCTHFTHCLPMKS